MASALQPVHERQGSPRHALAAAHRPRHRRHRCARPDGGHGRPRRSALRAVEAVGEEAARPHPCAVPSDRPLPHPRPVHALPVPAQRASGHRTEPPHRLVPAHGPAHRGRVGRGQARLLRPRPVRRRPRPRRHTRGARPQHPVARLGHLRRRLLPAGPRPPPRPRRGPAHHCPPVRLHAPRRRGGHRPRQRHGTRPERPVGAHHRHDDPRAEPQPQTGRRPHDRELAVGAVPSAAEPHPRPRRLSGDAPRHLRRRPHPPPVPGGPRPRDPARGLPQQPGPLPGERGRGLRQPDQRRLLVPEGDRVRGRDAQRDPRRAELLRHRLPGGPRRRPRPDDPAPAAVRACGHPRTPRRRAGLRAVRAGPRRPGRLRRRPARLRGGHPQLAPLGRPLPGRVAGRPDPHLPPGPPARPRPAGRRRLNRGRSLPAAAGPGARIVAVHVPGPGARAGLTAGDVLLALDGARIDSAAALARAVARVRPGDRVVLTVRHPGGGLRRLTVVPAVVA
ncbi:PDZ domain-containing protein [Streptomyces sp. WAC00469]|nr:PDZ domain-containing protein [Streptomyces sp. WAC00469]